MEYNILDFSKWEDEQEFGKVFRKMVEGLDLFYKGGGRQWRPSTVSQAKNKRPRP